MVEADAEECFVPAASVDDDVVQCGPARCVVGRFEVELRDGAEGRERAARRWVEVRGGVLTWVKDKDEASCGEVRCVEVLEEFGHAQEALEESQVEPVELRETRSLEPASNDSSFTENRHFLGLCRRGPRLQLPHRLRPRRSLHLLQKKQWHLLWGKWSVSHV
jgi:hypothetical protein